MSHAPSNTRRTDGEFEEPQTVQPGPSVASTRGRYKKKRSAEVCQRCNADLRGQRPYYQRYKICPDCSSQDMVIIDGIKQRFCQQCGKFQSLDLFGGRLKTCRERLNRHAARRRRATSLVQERNERAVFRRISKGKNSDSEYMDSDDEHALNNKDDTDDEDYDSADGAAQKQAAGASKRSVNYLRQDEGAEKMPPPYQHTLSAETDINTMPRPYDNNNNNNHRQFPPSHLPSHHQFPSDAARIHTTATTTTTPTWPLDFQNYNRPRALRFIAPRTYFNSSSSIHALIDPTTAQAYLDQVLIELYSERQQQHHPYFMQRPREGVHQNSFLLPHPVSAPHPAATAIAIATTSIAATVVPPGTMTDIANNAVQQQPPQQPPRQVSQPDMDLLLGIMKDQNLSSEHRQQLLAAVLEAVKGAR